MAKFMARQKTSNIQIILILWSPLTMKDIYHLLIFILYCKELDRKPEIPISKSEYRQKKEIIYFVLCGKEMLRNVVTGIVCDTHVFL